MKGLVSEFAVIIASEKETEVQRKARRAREERLGAKVRLCVVSEYRCARAALRHSAIMRHCSSVPLTPPSPHRFLYFVLTASPRPNRYTMQFKFWSTSKATRYMPLLNAQGETPMSLAARNHNHDFITTICQRRNLALPPGPQDDHSQRSTRMMSAVRTSDLTALLSVQPARVLEVLHDPALIRAVPQWCEHLTVGAETHTFTSGRPWEVAGARRGMNEAPSFWKHQLSSSSSFNTKKRPDSTEMTVCTWASRVNRCRRCRILFNALVPGGAHPKHNTRPPEQTQAYIVALDDFAGDAGERLIARLYEMDNVTLRCVPPPRSLFLRS